MSEYFGFAQELIEKKRAHAGEPYADAELYDLLNQRSAVLIFMCSLLQSKAAASLI